MEQRRVAAECRVHFKRTRHGEMGAGGRMALCGYSSRLLTGTGIAPPFSGRSHPAARRGGSTHTHTCSTAHVQRSTAHVQQLNIAAQRTAPTAAACCKHVGEGIPRSVEGVQIRAFGFRLLPRRDEPGPVGCGCRRLRRVCDRKQSSSATRPAEETTAQSAPWNRSERQGLGFRAGSAAVAHSPECLIKPCRQLRSAP